MPVGPPQLHDRDRVTPATRDSSQSRTYLTKANYRGPRLLKTINGGSSPAPRLPNTRSRSAPTVDPKMNDDEVFALPRDSSDEDEAVHTSAHAKTETRLKAPAPLPPPPPPPTRKSGRTKTARPSKRPKLQDQPDLLESKPQEKADENSLEPVTSQSTEWDMFGSQGASQRRSQNKFKNKYQRPPPVGLKSDTQDFKAPRAVPEKTTGLEKPHETKPATPALPDEQAAKPRKAFKTFDLPSYEMALPGSSGASQETSPSDVLDSPLDSRRLERSGSSPLSTLDSAKDDDETSDAEASDLKSNICPSCNKEVVRSRLANPGMDIREVRFFPLRKQQAFCHEHTLADAQAFSEEKGYPDVDWIRLITERIPKHNGLLKDIMQRKRSSHFLQELDTQITDKTNRKQVRDYLEKQRRESSLGPTGYYGAKGAQIMAEAIAQQLSRFMSGRVADEAIKTIGVGPFISNVLVPELTQKLIMEDMNIEDAAKARAIMHESAFTGMIMHPEDEKVERREDE